MNYNIAITEKNHLTNQTMKKNILLAFIICCSLQSIAQNPIPAGKEMKRVLLFGGMAHLGNGKVIETSAISLKDGKIVFVMDSRGFKPARDAYDTIIDLTGKHIYPGFIAMGTQLGLNEIELVRSTNDFNETGQLNPSSRAIIAYNTDSKITPTVRTNGILTAQIAPQGGMLSGTSSVVSLDAWNWEDAAYKTDEGIWMNWPSMRIVKASWAATEEEQQTRFEKSMKMLTQFFNDAKAYNDLGMPAIHNQHFEAMKALFTGTKKLYVRANLARDIIAAVNFCKLYKVQMVLVGGEDSWRVTDILKANNIPVIIMRTQALPMRDDEDVYASYKLPSLLKNAGIDFAITDDGYWKIRNLPFEAGMAAGYGLSKEDALTSITLSPARILGIDKTTGSLEKGKDATLFVSTGDALDMRTNQVELAYILGKEIDLHNIQQQLYHKYMKKYGFE